MKQKLFIALLCIGMLLVATSGLAFFIYSGSYAETTSPYNGGGLGGAVSIGCTDCGTAETSASSTTTTFDGMSGSISSSSASASLSLEDDCEPPCEDIDEDGVCDDEDNCPGIPPGNPDQSDFDEDGVGDQCDNCIQTFNPDQLDSNNNGIGDACDTCDDADGDGICDIDDNCPDVYNPNQMDSDGDGLGDDCDDCNDPDADGICNPDDNCPNTYNPDQADLDGDQIGDACDDCVDSDFDGVCDQDDVCPDTDVVDPVNEDGCSIPQLCPCNVDPTTGVMWSEPGRYQTCIVNAAQDFVSAGIISPGIGCFSSTAGTSDCAQPATQPMMDAGICSDIIPDETVLGICVVADEFLPSYADCY